MLLFARLGTYALWDDEANTAIFAANVARFGDTLAWDGTNLVAFREGLELTGIKNRVYPPGQYFFAAPFLGVLGRSAWAARFPFALAAFAGFVLWAWWLRRALTPVAQQVAMYLLALGNVSLFLYSRQARYYGLGWALSLGLVFLYVHRAESRRWRVLFALGSAALLAVHYLSYGATMVVLAGDFTLFELRKRTDSWRQVGAFLGSQILAAAVIVGVFNPLGRKVTDYVPASWWADKLKLFWWNLRDLNACEFMWSPILAVAVLVWALGRFRDGWLIRAVLAMVVYAFVASVLSVQPVGWAQVSDIRYMSATIPLGIFITARTLTSLPKLPSWVGVGLAAVLAFWTGPWSWFQGAVGAPTAIPLRSTLGAFVGELQAPQRSAYREATDWLNAHVPAGSTVFAMPDYAAYPIVFHSPGLQLMWQLRQDQRATYPMLGEHHFKYLGTPDVIVAFGPDVHRARGLVAQLSARGVPYEPEVRLDVMGPDRTRPELFWRDFATQPPRDPGSDATYLFRRAGLAQPPAVTAVPAP